MSIRHQILALICGPMAIIVGLVGWLVAERHSEMASRALLDAEKEQSERRRRASEAERATVTESIARALAGLARKQLAYRIAEPFPEAFEELKANFNSVLNEIDSATQQNAAMAEQASAACRGLVDDSARLVETIVGFHLSGQQAVDRLAA